MTAKKKSNAKKKLTTEEILLTCHLLTRQQVEQLIGLGRSHIYALVRAGKFPEPVKITDGPKGAVRWVKAEVLAWLETRPRTGRRPGLPAYQPGQAAQAQA